MTLALTVEVNHSEKAVNVGVYVMNVEEIERSSMGIACRLSLRIKNIYGDLLVIYF